MAGQFRYTIYDAARKRWLCFYHRPVSGCDAAVTRWTRHPGEAMRFPGAKSARSVAVWLDSQRYGGVVVLNAKGEMI